jgi:hypothetical protein
LDDFKRVKLQLVPTERVRPHEIADPGRAQRIEQRLRQDGLLRDPLLVGAVPDVEGYVLLDGTNRLASLVKLELPLALIQIIDYADPHAVELRTWCHSPPLALRDLVTQVVRIPGLTIDEVAPLGTVDAVREPGTIAVAVDRSSRYVIKQSAGHQYSRVEQLRKVVDLYEDRMVRVDCSVEDLEERIQTADHSESHSTVLVAFPQFSRSQVVSLALGGALIPAGITRHIIRSGRALRVNVPLDLLAIGESGAQKALERHLSALQPRIYREPTILFDS